MTGRRRYTPSGPPQQTAPLRTGGITTTQQPATEPTDRARQHALLQAAFRDLHGARLHGFALLLSLGDRPLAAGVASRALAEGAARVGELRHPERAATWLRHRVLRLLPRDAGRRSDPAGGDMILEGLGLPAYAAAGLRALPLLDRAALIAADLERLEQRDVAAIVGCDEDRLQRMLVRARRRYAAASTRAMPAEQDPDGGPLRRRIVEHASAAMGSGGAR